MGLPTNDSLAEKDVPESATFWHWFLIRCKYLNKCKSKCSIPFLTNPDVT